MTPAMISQPVTVELAGDPLAKQVADLRVRLAEAEMAIKAMGEVSGQMSRLDTVGGKEESMRLTFRAISDVATHHLFGKRRA